MEHFVIIVNGFQPFPIITKRSLLDAAEVLDPLLRIKDTLNAFDDFNSNQPKCIK